MWITRSFFGGLFLFLLSATAGCGDDGSSESDGSLPDTYAGDAGADLGPTPKPDAEVETACSADRPDGICPAGRVCQQGGCIVDLDPKDPVDAQQALALLDTIWTFYDQSYGAFPAKQLDWSAVKTTYTPLVAQATSGFQVRWALTRMVSEIGDGHTAAYSKKLCAQTSPYGNAHANVGGCVTEVQGSLLVYKAKAGAALQPGDEVVSIDGRGTEALLRDLELQPRCSVSASTQAMQRAQLVAGVLLRAPTDKQITLRRGGKELTLDVTPSLAWQNLIPCDGRIGPAQVEGHLHGIRSATLAGDIFYIYLPMFGAYDDAGNFITQPVIDELRKLFQQATTAKGMVLDLRANPGGAPQIYLALASWLYPAATTLFYCQSKTGTGHGDHGPKWPMTSTPDPTLQYSGPLAVLISPRSFSASDFSSAFLHETGRAKTFGAPSGGGFGGGNSKPLAEDADWTLGFNDILCSDLKGNYLEGNPPPVDFPVAYAPADIEQGVDTVIEAARSWLVQQGVP